MTRDRDVLELLAALLVLLVIGSYACDRAIDTTARRNCLAQGRAVVSDWRGDWRCR